MSVPDRVARPLYAAALGMHVLLCATTIHAAANSAAARVRIPPTIAVRKELGPPPAGVTELKFHDVFKLPVGPRGLEPTDKLRQLEAAGDFTSRLALLEELKTAPAGAVWDYHCARQNVPVGSAWLAEIKSYERDVLSKR